MRVAILCVACQWKLEETGKAHRVGYVGMGMGGGLGGERIKEREKDRLGWAL